MITVFNQLNGNIYALEQALGVDTAQYETSFVEGFRPLCAGADTHSRERMTNACEEAAFLGQCAAIAHHCKGVHLQAVVIVEAQRLMLNHTLIELETACLQTLAASWMTAVENRHIILLSHLVNGIEQRQEILFRINILFSVSREQDLFAFLQAQALVNITGLNLRQVVM